ncbi:MAG: methyltransferase domain-containing protein [Planctomycetota bacterium]
MLTARRLVNEMMDEPDADPAALAVSLAFIRRVNRRLGGTGAAVGHLRQWSRSWPTGETIRILDVGTGSADIPAAIADWASRAGHRVHVTAVDRHPTTLALAREFLGPRDDIELVEADAQRLTDRFEAAAFDYAHAGMFLHHLSDIEVMTVLREMQRLSRRGLIWNDLVRGLVGRVGVRLLTWRAPAMVRHDARVSVDAGFTRREARELASRVGLPNVRVRGHLLHRFTLTSQWGES